MPAVKINWGGWRDWQPDKVRVMWGGWFNPRLIYIKDGTGTWRDTGYHTSPNPPVSLRVHSWDFSTVNIQFAGPGAAAGVTAPSSYEIAMNNSDDTQRLATVTGNTSGFASFSVSQNGRYKFYARSKTAGGLYSAWAGPIQVGIGHYQQTAQRWAQGSRDWRTGFDQYGMSNGQVVGPTAPAYNTNYGFATGVYVTDIQLEVWTPYGWPTLWGLERSAYHLGNSAADINGAMQNFDVYLTYGPSWTASPFRGRWSNGGCWGIWVSGSGYDNKYGPYLPIYERVQIAGTEYYPYLEDYVSVAQQDNYYW